MPAPTTERPYTVGRLVQDTTRWKGELLDIANQVYRILHEIEDAEESAIATVGGKRAG